MMMKRARSLSFAVTSVTEEEAPVYSFAVFRSHWCSISATKRCMAVSACILLHAMASIEERRWQGTTVFTTQWTEWLVALFGGGCLVCSLRERPKVRAVHCTISPVPWFYLVTIVGGAHVVLGLKQTMEDVVRRKEFQPDLPLLGNLAGASVYFVSLVLYNVMLCAILTTFAEDCEDCVLMLKACKDSDSWPTQENKLRRELYAIKIAIRKLQQRSGSYFCGFVLANFFTIFTEGIRDCDFMSSALCFKQILTGLWRGGEGVCRASSGGTPHGLMSVDRVVIIVLATVKTLMLLLGPIVLNYKLADLNAACLKWRVEHSQLDPLHNFFRDLSIGYKVPIFGFPVRPGMLIYFSTSFRIVFFQVYHLAEKQTMENHVLPVLIVSFVIVVILIDGPSARIKSIGEPSTPKAGVMKEQDTNADRGGPKLDSSDVSTHSTMTIFTCMCICTHKKRHQHTHTQTHACFYRGPSASDGKGGAGRAASC